jgi:ferrous-iron efflux pump FieF
MAPADKEHRFGHGKAEALAGLAQALLILVSIGLLLTQTLGRLWNPLVVENTPIGISIMLVSMVLTGALVVFQWYVVKRTQSNAIKADSLH